MAYKVEKCEFSWVVMHKQYSSNACHVVESLLRYPVQPGKELYDLEAGSEEVQ